MGGRFSSETAQFLWDLANAKVREVTVGESSGSCCVDQKVELHVGVCSCPRVRRFSLGRGLLCGRTGPHHQCTQSWVMTVTQCEVRCFFQCCGREGTPFHLCVNHHSTGQKIGQVHFHPICKKKTRQKTLSSKNTFIQKWFRPTTRSSKTVSSNDTFIQSHFHPKPRTLSPKT